MATLRNTTPPSGNVDSDVIDLTQDEDELGSPSRASYRMRARDPLRACYEGTEFISLDTLFGHTLFGKIEGMEVDCNKRSDGCMVTKQNQQEASPSELESGKDTKVSSMGPECAICMEELSSKGSGVSSTTCGHLFCTKCLKDALKVDRRCPKCRKKVTAKGFHPVFF